MEKAYKYRIYPNKRQKELLAKTFGCCRFVYNHFLNKRIETYQTEQKTLSYNQCSSELTKLKSELEWLRAPDKCSLQNAIKDMDRAYKNYFKNNAGFPKYKSKKTHRFSYRTNATNGNIADVSWSEFARQLEYKADWYGKTIIKVDKWYASSQICSCCGEQFPITKNLSIREWICPNCHTVLDRDGNAAINILREGKRILANVA